ncbi:MAG: hypothetical protein NXY57DRAFT_965726 [Lentinula lateritia]|nr:MAG: hypothetical protein NXY57DRAFT_965726 [Lentinula lateritia]
MDKDKDDDYPLDYDNGTDNGGTDELVDSQPLQDDDSDNNRSQTVPEEDFQISPDYDHEPSSAITPMAFLLDPAALASCMLQLSGALCRRAQPSRVTTNPSPPSSLLPVPSSRRSLANQSAESFSSAGGISNAPSPSCLQPPPPRGSCSHKKSGPSVVHKPKDPDSVPRTIAYLASSELQQRPSAGKEMNSNQILRVEANTVRIELMLRRMIEELRSSLMSAAALHHQELLQASAAERTQMEARLMGSLQDNIRGITRSELKLLESNLQQKLTSLLPMEAINRLLSSLENTFTHLYDPVPPTQGLPTSTPPPNGPPCSTDHTSPVNFPPHLPSLSLPPRISSTTQLPLLLTRLQDGPSSSQPKTVSFEFQALNDQSWKAPCAGA